MDRWTYTYSYAGSPRYPTHLTHDPSGIRKPLASERQEEKVGTAKKRSLKLWRQPCRTRGLTARTPVLNVTNPSAIPDASSPGAPEGDDNASDKWGKRNEMIDECGKREGVRCAHRSLIRHDVSSIGEEKKGRKTPQARKMTSRVNTIVQGQEPGRTGGG